MLEKRYRNMSPDPVEKPTVENLLATLGQVVADLRTEIGATKEYGHHNRKIIKIVAFSVMFDILLSVGLGYGLTEGRKTADRAKTVAETLAKTQYSGCLFGNQSRGDEKAVWDKLFNIVIATPDPKQTPEQRAAALAAVDQLQALANKALGPRVCTVPPK
jgi:hypothetical protein